MLRSAAIARIKDGLGFRAGPNLDGTIALRLQEAQRDLESGKTLPRFLLKLDQTLSLAAGSRTVLLPERFIRESDETRIRFFPANSEHPKFMVRRYLIDALQANWRGATEVAAPSTYVVRRGKGANYLDFISPAAQDYTLLWDFYEAGTILDTDDENEWLAAKGGAEWLIGEAGERIAMDLRNVNAVTLFQQLKQRGRASVFGEDLASETASGPIVMGANL